MPRNGRASGSGEAGAPAADGRELRDPEARARQVCLRLLTAAPRTRAQLAQAMHRAGIPAEAADAVLARFADVGLIDDAVFARAWVESRHHSRGLSKRSLSAELRRQGVQSEEIREAVDALDPEQEVATARRLVERKMAGTRGRPPEARARQAAGLLARKGYPPGLAFRLIREAFQAEGLREEGMDLDADPYLDPDADDDVTDNGRDRDTGYALLNRIAPGLGHSPLAPVAGPRPAPAAAATASRRIAAGRVPCTFRPVDAPSVMADDTLLDKKVIKP